MRKILVGLMMVMTLVVGPGCKKVDPLAGMDSDARYEYVRQQLKIKHTWELFSVGDLFEAELLQLVKNRDSEVELKAVKLARYLGLRSVLEAYADNLEFRKHQMKPYVLEIIPMPVPLAESDRQMIEEMIEREQYGSFEGLITLVLDGTPGAKERLLRGYGSYVAKDRLNAFDANKRFRGTLSARKIKKAAFFVTDDSWYFTEVSIQATSYFGNKVLCSLYVNRGPLAEEEWSMAFVKTEQGWKCIWAYMTMQS